jgi:poly-beta-1,6-N-acetyl-D-glucosamine synthase
VHPQARELAESMKHPVPTYVLISPARNEESFIERTIQSVIDQTVRPLRWVIVSDGSTDQTDEIVKRYLGRHDWIELVQRAPRQERDFAGKVRAFNEGFERIKSLRYDVIGNLDADISVTPDYFEFLLTKFTENVALGLAGTPYTEDGEKTYDYRFASAEDVPGACQLFRRECYEAIGGYKPMKAGGVDLAVVLAARKHGWQTRCFLERNCSHARPQGTAQRKGVRKFFHAGTKDYLLGCHPLWELGRGFHHVRKRPYGLVAVCLMAGYFTALLRRTERSLPSELVQFRQKEQLTRLKVILGLTRPQAKGPLDYATSAQPKAKLGT